MTPKQKAMRKKIEAYVIEHMNYMDPSKKNGKRYEEFFSGLSDAEFDKWMRDLKEGKDVLIFYSANIEDKVKIENLVAETHRLKLKLFEKLRIWDDVTQKYYLTPNEYFVAPQIVRRFSQFADHKLSVPESDKRIDMLTGQVVKPDQAAGITLPEVQSLYGRGLNKTLLELLKFRGGDVTALAEYKRELEETGATSIGKETGSIVRSAVILDVFFSGAHIQTNASGM